MKPPETSPGVRRGRFSRSARRLGLIVAIAGVGVIESPAQSLTWDPTHTPSAPTGGSGTWLFNNGADWSNGAADVVWNNASRAIFPNTPVPSPQVFIGGGGVTATGLEFGSSTAVGVYSIRGDPLTLTAGASLEEASTSGTVAEVHARILNTGGLSVSNIRLRLFASNNTYSGFTSIGAGAELAASSPGSASPNSAFIVNGLLDLSGATNTIGSLTGVGVVSNSIGSPTTLTIGSDQTSTGFDGRIENGAGAVALTKIGGGTLTLRGANTYSGGTNVSAGVLAVSSATGLGTGSGSVTVQGNAELRFLGAALAGGGAITARGTTTSAILGGTTRFQETANAGNVVLFNDGALLADGSRGETRFEDNSRAGSASVTNRPGPAGSSSGGATIFQDLATAQAAIFENAGGASIDGLGGLAQFGGNATAGGATFANRGGAAARAGGGAVQFFENASAGAALFSNHGGAVATASGGSLLFVGTSTATTAQISNFSSGAVGAMAGRTAFTDQATAARASIFNRAASSGLDRFGGFTDFFATATAAQATIMNEGAPTGDVADAGATSFRATATAGQATIANHAGQVGGAAGGRTIFTESATAGSATITNLAGGNGLGLGGFTSFLDNATAGSAALIVDGSSATGEGVIEFSGASTAAGSTITARGAPSAGGVGGRVTFRGAATAGQAVLMARSSPVAGQAGGRFVFENMTEGGTASATIEAGANLDLSRLSDAGMTLGSIAGAGRISLGSKELTVGGNNANTTFSGIIADGGLQAGNGGSLTKTGLGTLTLAGANTYTGDTTVVSGTLTLNGPLPNATIRSLGGVLNLNADISGSTVEVSPAAATALVNVTHDAELTSLVIADGGRVVLLASVTGAAPVHAVPEPSVLALLIFSAFGLLRRARLQG